jgi:5-methylcytosine-specific restriction endonuclease McrA
MRRSLSKTTRLAVKKRANYCCEYCKIHEEDMYLAYEIDHIISL